MSHNFDTPTESLTEGTRAAAVIGGRCKTYPVRLFCARCGASGEAVLTGDDCGTCPACDSPLQRYRDFRSIRLDAKTQAACDAALSLQMAQQDGYEMVGGGNV